MTTTCQLSKADREFYHANGYVCLRDVLPQALLDDCRIVLESWVDSMARTWQEQRLISDLKEAEDFDHRFYELWKDAGKPHHSRSPRHELVKLQPQRVFQMLAHDSLVDAASFLLGTDEIISHGIWNSRPKAPSSRFTDTPMHQDAQYYRDQAGTHIVSMWFPLHAVDEERSCLAVSPVPDFEMARLYENDESTDTGFVGIHPDEAKQLKQIPISMQPGDLLCFTELTPHGAWPNRTDLMRWSMDVRFVGAERAHPDAMQHGLQVRSKDPDKLTSYETWLNKWDESAY